MHLKIFSVLMCFYISSTNAKHIEPKDFPCWSMNENYHYTGLFNAPYYTRASCLRYCISIDDCFVANFDAKIDPPCWTQRPGQVVDIETKIKHHPTCDNYLLDRGCLEPRIVPYSTDMCWSRKESYEYQGLEAVSGIESVGGCLNYCAGLEMCNTANFYPANSENQCWVQKSGETSKENFQEHNTASNYILNRECLALFEDHRVYNTDLCWKRIDDTEFSGEKVHVENAKDINECLNLCNDQDCEVVHFDISKAKPCFIKSTTGPALASFFKPKNGISSFILDKKCFS